LVTLELLRLPRPKNPVLIDPVEFSSPLRSLAKAVRTTIIMLFSSFRGELGTRPGLQAEILELISRLRSEPIEDNPEAKNNLTTKVKFFMPIGTENDQGMNRN